MRITMRELNRQMLHVINDRSYDMSKLQEQIATGKKLTRPSDDPVDVANTLKLETKLKELTQFNKNINDGISYMNVTGSSLDSMNDIMQRVRELAVQGSSDTLSSSERVYLNKECSQLFRQMISLTDTQYKGDYIFSGTQTKTQPYQVDQSKCLTIEDYNNNSMAYFNAAAMPVGSTVQLFKGSDGSVIKNIIPDSFKLSIAGTDYTENTDYTINYEDGTMTILNAALAINATPASANYAIGQVALQFDSISIGEDIYGDPISSWGKVYREIESGISMEINTSINEVTLNTETGIDMVGTMVRLGQNLLQNNRTGIEDAIGEIDSVFSAMRSAQSSNGAKINRFEITLSRNENQFTSTSENQSKLTDTDLAEAAMNYSMAQTVYNAALKSAANIMQQSLVNYL